MKIYTNPKIEIIKINEENIICTSGGGMNDGGNGDMSGSGIGQPFPPVNSASVYSL